MALVVTHNSTADGDPLIDGDDWNANHTLTGGGTLRVPVLIESKTLNAGTTTTTFSSLNGDVDKEYLIVGKVTLAPSGSDNTLILQPNGDTGANYVGVMLTGLTTTTVGATSTSALRIGQSNNVATSYLMFNATLNPVSGVVRQFRADGSLALSGRNMVSASSGHWTNTADNITTLVVVVSNGSYSGVIKLYKMVDLTI